MLTDLVISQSDSRPMYVQIMEQIRQRIAVGELTPGSELPSIRELAVALRVSVITIKRAYLELEHEGTIVTQHGKGSTVAPDPDLSLRFYQQQMTEHVEQVARLGKLLGLSHRELARRLREATDRLNNAETGAELMKERV